MDNETGPSMPLTKVEIIFFIVACLFVIGGCQSSKPTNTASTNEPTTTSPPSSTSDIQKQHREAEQQLRPEIEAQRQQNENEAKQALDQGAIAAVSETEGAIKFISENKKDEALAAIEQATGKINILLARNPASALIPVDAEVVAIDTAPTDPKAIDQIVQLATIATARRELPAARTLLASVISELRIRTTNLPLATYPAALQQAAKLLDQGKNQDAGNVLLTALNTLEVVDHVIPIPLILAQAAIEAAKSQRQNKDAALTLLQAAKNELNRSRQLGYLANDPEYKGLDTEISSLESAIKGTGDTSSLFSHLRDRIAAFLKRQKDHEQR
jgi:hypothetical protein